MKTTMIRLLLLALSVITGFAACAAEPVLTLRAGIACKEGSLRADMLKIVADEVSAATKGAVKLEPKFYAESDAQTLLYDEFRDGAVDVVCLEPWVLAANFPPAAALAQPFLFPSSSEAGTFFNGSGGDRLQEIVAPSGLRILAWMECMAQNFATTRSVESVNDFHELRLAASNNIHLATMLSKLGTKVTSGLTMEERFPALEKGVMEAVECDMADMAAHRDAVAKAGHFVATTHYFPHLAVCLSNTTWGKVPDEAKEGFLEGIRTGVGQAVIRMNDAELDANTALQEMGVQFHFVNREEVLERLQADMRAVTRSDDQLLQKVLEEAAVPQAVM